ncbi:MAG: hypothetical protein ACXAEL_11175 [Candidatus Hodarchaeales archaeon]
MIRIQKNAEELRSKAQKIGSLGSLLFLIGFILGIVLFFGKSWYIAAGMLHLDSLSRYVTVGILLVLFLGVGVSLWQWSEDLYLAAAEAEFEKGPKILEKA